MSKEKLFYIVFVMCCTLSSKAQQVLVCPQATISFFSSAPLEDIEGISKAGSSAINLKDGAILFKVKNTSFQFKKKLMQEHFNETYMESDKHPLSEFKGKIDDPDKLTQDGTYQVNISGILTVHGIPKNYTTQAKLTVNNGTISAICSFQVKTADHDIKIPSIVVKNIAEVIDVTISATYKTKTI